MHVNDRTFLSISGPKATNVRQFVQLLREVVEAVRPRSARLCIPWAPAGGAADWVLLATKATIRVGKKKLPELEAVSFASGDSMCIMPGSQRHHVSAPNAIHRLAMLLGGGVLLGGLVLAAEGATRACDLEKLHETLPEAFSWPAAEMPPELNNQTTWLYPGIEDRKAVVLHKLAVRSVRFTLMHNLDVKADGIEVSLGADMFSYRRVKRFLDHTGWLSKGVP